MWMAATGTTPEVDLRFTDGVGHVTGSAASVGATEFMRPCLNHLEQRLAGTSESGWTLTIDLNPIASTWYPHLVRVLELFDAASKNSGSMARVIWRYRPENRSTLVAVQTAGEKYPGLVIAQAVP